MQRKQVGKEHYYKDYDNERRILSYWEQIKIVANYNPEDILEIGIGNGFVSTYIENRGYDIITVDIDEELNPDIVEDVRSLTDSFNENSFDVILCAEVLEHIPFKDFEKALNEIGKVTKKNVILTLPNWGIPFNLRLRIPKIDWRLTLRLPFPIKHKFNGEHYWEIGKRDYSLSTVEDKIKKYFEIEEDYLMSGNSYHRVFKMVVKDDCRLDVKHLKEEIE